MNAFGKVFSTSNGCRVMCIQYEPPKVSNLKEQYHFADLNTFEKKVYTDLTDLTLIMDPDLPTYESVVAGVLKQERNVQKQETIDELEYKLSILEDEIDETEEQVERLNRWIEKKKKRCEEMKDEITKLTKNE